MSTNTGSADYGRFEELAEEFAARFRRGERPSVREYIDRCPDLADEIRELFPALVEVERVKEDQPAQPSAAEAAAAPPSLGQVGDYRIVREVGRGGMGVVFEAEQVSLGRRVALKVLPRQVSSDLETLARFRREARSAAQLHHTNIVPVFEVGKDGDVSYYAMQFIQGQGLDLVIDELRRLQERAHPTGPARKLEPLPLLIPSRPTGPAPSRSRPVSLMAQSLLAGRFVLEAPGRPGEAEAAGVNRASTAASADRRDPDATEAPPASENSPAAVSSPPSSVVLPGGSQLSAIESGRRPFYRSVAHIGRQVAAGLGYAHARGIVHRDIKPSNLLLDTRGVVWITDFGLAKSRDDGLTQTGDILGTIRYMAPERFRGEADSRADIYALGLTLYELLTLRPAFDSSDRLTLIEQIKTEDPPRPRALDPRIPRELETIVLKAISKDPKDRYQTAEGLGEDLRRFRADEPILARRIGVWQRAALWARRRPGEAALVAVSAMAALAMIGVAVSLWYSDRLRAALDDARRFQYFQHITLAGAAWEDGNMGRLEKLLDTCPPEYREQWESRYLERQCRSELLRFEGHRGGIFDLEYSADGKLLATASLDGTAMLWDAVTGRPVRPIEGHTYEVYGVAFSPDGIRLATASRDGTVKVWDVATGKVIRDSSHGGGEYGWHIAFSPDGGQLASAGSDGVVRIWDLATGDRVARLEGHSGPINYVAFSPDGSRLASAGSDKTVRLWDATTRRVIHTLEGHSDIVYGLTFSPDGKRLASASADRVVKLWEVMTGRLLRDLEGHVGEVVRVAFSPDGSLLASASGDPSVKLWNVASGKNLLTLRGHAGEVFDVAFSPDGSRLATSSQDRTLKVWEFGVDPTARALLGHVGPVNGVAVHPDGSRLASAGADGTVRLWDVTSGLATILQGHREPVLSVAFSRGGSLLVSADQGGSVRLWDVATGVSVGRPLVHPGGEVSALAFHPDGEHLATAGADGIVRVWEVRSARVVAAYPGHSHSVRSLVYSPDGRYLATGGEDRTVMVRDTAENRVIHKMEGHTCWVHGVAYSPNGKYLSSASSPGPGSPPLVRLASGSGDGNLIIWDAMSGHPIHIIPGHGNYVRGVAFNPDGTRLASASMDRTIKLWDVASGEEILTLRGHDGGVNGVAFSPDGTFLASAGADGSVRIWDARPLTPEAAIGREALGLLDFLLARPLCKADVIDYLRDAPTIRLQARQLALSLVDRYREQTDPEMYHRASRALVLQPYLNVFQYRLALLQAQHAARLAPDRQEYRNGLGAALYRTGRYREAVQTLEEADRAGKGSPVVLAFLAMAHHQLGQREKARSALARLQPSLDRPHGTKDAETLDLVHEARALIASQAATTAR